MLRHMNLVPGADTTPLSMILTSSIAAVGVTTSPLWFIQLPPSTHHVLFGSSFWGLTVHPNLQYVTSRMQWEGILCLWMNTHVLVGSLILPLTPWKSRPILFADNRLHFPAMTGSEWLILSILEHLTSFVVHYCQCCLEHCLRKFSTC